MKYKQILSITILSLSTVGCAMTSGFQTHELPEEDGVFTTDLGTPISLIKVTQETLPTVQPAQIAYSRDYAFLFQNKNPLYLLSPGDSLSIQLWAYPEITPPLAQINNDQAVTASGYQIDQNGYIQFPMIGRYKASGKSLNQVNKELRSQLSHYLKTPDVVVRVLSYQGQRYSVQGNVMRGGQFFLSDQPTSVYTALGLAGGVTDKGDNTAIQLIRHGQTYDLNVHELEKMGYSLHNLMIKPNDTLYINARENQKIYIMGESGRNQALTMRDQGLNLSDVLGESLGINPLSASASKIYVLRTNSLDHTTAMYRIDLSNFADFGLANQFKMRSNDIVYVDATGLTRWQRIVNQVIPFSNALYNVDRLGQ